MVVDNETWIKNQFAQCDLKHTKRTERLQIVAAQMLDAPEASLPAQSKKWKDLKAAYRLFARPEVTYQAVCQTHWQQTRQTNPGRYLLISDTTDIVVTATGADDEGTTTSDTDDDTVTAQDVACSCTVAWRTTVFTIESSGKPVESFFIGRLNQERRRDQSV